MCVYMCVTVCVQPEMVTPIIYQVFLLSPSAHTIIINDLSNRLFT
jgi:hypothetical protein